MINATSGAREGYDGSNKRIVPIFRPLLPKTKHKSFEFAYVIYLNKRAKTNTICVAQYWQFFSSYRKNNTWKFHSWLYFVNECAWAYCLFSLSSISLCCLSIPVQYVVYRDKYSKFNSGFTRE